MPRGGRRKGNPGAKYPNRSDLRGPVPVQAASGQPYGARGAQENAQRSVPMAPSPTASPSSAPQQAPAGPAPGSLPDLLRPTERPGEPLTAGVASGPGPGPEALAMTGNPDRDELGAIYMRYPSEGLRELLEELDEEEGLI